MPLEVPYAPLAPLTVYQRLQRIILVGSLCLAMALYSAGLAQPGNALAPLWFPTAMLTIAFYRTARRYWLELGLTGFLAIFIACVFTDHLSPPTLALMATNVAEAALSAWLLCRWLPENDPLPDLRHWFIMAAICAVAVPLFGTMLLFLLTNTLWSWALFSLSMLSEAIPAITLIPVGLLWRKSEINALRGPAQLGEFVVTLLLTLALSALALYQLPWPFAVIIVLLMWSAVRLPRLATFGVLLCTLLMVVTQMQLRAELPVFASMPIGSQASWFPFLLLLLPANIMTMVMHTFRQEHQHIADSEARFRNAMEYSAIGMALVSPNGSWLQVNRALCRFLNYSAEQLQNMKFQSITWPEDLDADLTQLARLQRGEIETYSMEKRYITGDGNRVWGRLAVSAVRCADRSPRYYIAQIEDISELKLSEQTNKRLVERVTLANEAGGIGIWEWDLQADILRWDRRMFEMYGLPPETKLCYNDWRDSVVAEDRNRIDEIIQNAIHTCAPIDSEFRVNLADGQHYIRVLARRIRDPQRKIDRMLGVNIDVTELRVVTRALEQEKERLNVILHSLNEAVICTDSQQAVTFINPVACRLIGWRMEDALGRPLLDMLKITTGDDSPALTNLREAATGDQDSVLHNRRGDVFDIHYSVTPLNDANRENRGSVVVIHDVSEAREQLRALSYDASHDALTGLANRARFEHALQDILARPIGQPHALAFIDLDRFKAVNDDAGHAAGDALLREIAQLMQRQLRPGDLLARLGGDEFGLFMPDCSADLALQLVTRLINAIRDYKLRWQDKLYGVGASAGVTQIDNHAKTLSELLAQADSACYEAKRAGRGFVSRFNQPETPSADLLNELQQQTLRGEITFRAWPVTSNNSRTARFWWIEPEISGALSGCSIADFNLSRDEQIELALCRDRRVIPLFFQQYAQRITHRSIGIALPVALSSLTDRGITRALFSGLNGGLPPRLCHLALYGDSRDAERELKVIHQLSALGCPLIYRQAHCSADIFNTPLGAEINYLHIAQEALTESKQQLMNELQLRLLQGEARRHGVHTLCGPLNKRELSDTLNTIGIELMFGEAISPRQPLAGLLDNVLFGIH